MNRKEFLQASSILSIGLLMESLGLKAQTTLGSNNVTYYTSKDALYNTLRKGFNARINKLPTIIADCKNTKGVQEAILHAKQLNLKVSVKSGGHCMEGFSTGSGMQIIVANLNKIEWLSSYKIKVGPGVLLSQLYDNLIPKNRILQGGSCAAVAVGGLSLGGGYGLMSRLFGLTCDSLERVTMVDGNGNIINSEQDPELLWACKGGGNGNFGVITEMVFKVHNRPSQMSSYRFRSHNLNTERGKEILKTWFAESEKLPKACFSTCLFNKDNSYILLTNVSKSNTAVQSFINKMKSINDKYTANPNVPIAKALKNYYGIQQPTRFKKCICRFV